MQIDNNIIYNDTKNTSRLSRCIIVAAFRRNDDNSTRWRQQIFSLVLIFVEK